MPKLSVIIPVYNAENYLEKCVNSVFDTFFDSFEVILVDDGSTDGSLAVEKNLSLKYPEKIQVIRQKNQGGGIARNTGIQAASGKYLYFIDSDDYLIPHAMDTIAEILTKDFDIAIFDAMLVNKHGKEIETLRGCRKQPENIFKTPELLFEFPAPWNKIVRKSLIIDTGIFFPPRVRFEDLTAVSKLYLHARQVLYVPKSLYRYVMRKNSVMNTSQCEKSLESIDAINDIIEYYKSQGMYEKFYRELEYLAFQHQLIVSTTRVNQIDPKSGVQVQLKENFLQKFPDYRNNPYVGHAPWQEKVVLFFILRGWYPLLHTIMAWNRRRKGKEV